MIILLITNQEYLMDIISHYLNNENIKLLIATELPDNYGFYDIIITDNVKNPWNVNNPIIFITPEPFQWIRSINIYNLLLPLKKNELMDVINHVKEQKVHHYPYVNIEEKYKNYENIFQALDDIKKFQNQWSNGQNDLNKFYKNINDQVNKLQDNFIKSYEKILDSNQEIHHKFQEISGIKLMKSTMEKIYKNKIILNFSAINIYDWYNQWTETLTMESHIKDLITDTMINLVELFYYHPFKNFQEIIFEINCCMENNDIFFKIQIINGKIWDPMFIMFLQNHFNLNMTIINDKKINFSKKIINIKDIITI